MRAKAQGSPAAAVGGGRLEVRRLARWILGIRMVGLGAVIITALILQTLVSEPLPLQPLFFVAGWGFALSLLWIALWLAGLDPSIHGLLQLLGDVLLITAIVYFTGGAWSPFAFLLLAPVMVAALLFGLAGSIALAAASFLAYLAMVQLVVFKVLPPPASISALASPRPPSLTLQLVLTGLGFASVALLTSYLAHSLQKAEASLQAQRAAAARALALTQDVLRSVESGVLATDLEGRVLLANPAASQVVGAQESLEGKSLEEALPLVGVSWQEVLAACALGQGRKLEALCATNQRPVGCTVTPLASASQQVLGAVVHFRDLTEAQEAAKREKLRERMVTVGEMAASIAHEIRNPLAAISGAAQVLASRSSLPEEEQRLLRIVVSESKRLSGIIESFLTYARPPEPHWGPCDIANTLEETLELFSHSPEVGAHHRILRHILPHGQPVRADGQLLRQAFFNLARNAIQAMPQGGTLRVEGVVEGPFYVIRFADEGEGMEAQKLEEIFQPFKGFRRGGTGLGLAVVYAIVNEHGGKITVDSRPGAGSTFSLYIPLRSEEELASSGVSQA